MLIKMEDGEKIIENNIIGLVTARGGSTRLPRKNILSFCGHPLVAWSIMQLRCSKYINDVYLTTDDEEIAEIGEQYGAKIIMREVLNNDISAGYVLKLAVEELEKNNIKIDQIFYSLPTSPLKKINDVDSIIDSFNFINNFINAGEIKPVAIEKECYIYQGVTPTNIPLDSLGSDITANDTAQHSLTFKFDGSPLTSSEPGVTTKVVSLLEGMHMIGKSASNDSNSTYNRYWEVGQGDKTQIAVGGYGKSGRHAGACLDHLTQAGIFAPHRGEGILIQIFEIENVVHLFLH